MVLYPKTGVSSIQRAQMTSTPIESTHTIGIEGDFDWCQTAVKTLFNDVEFQAELEAEYGVNLSAANSMNWGRLLPQVVYHTSAYLDLVTSGVIEMGDPVDVCVPTGNFGNVLAAVYAKAMGIPFRNFTVAANKNNVLADLLETVRARPGRLSALSVFHSKSILYGACVWERRALNSPKRRFPARAGGLRHQEALPQQDDLAVHRHSDLVQLRADAAPALPAGGRRGRRGRSEARGSG